MNTRGLTQCLSQCLLNGFPFLFRPLDGFLCGPFASLFFAHSLPNLGLFFAFDRGTNGEFVVML